MVQVPSFHKWIRSQFCEQFGGQRQRKSKTVLMMRLMDRFYNSLPMPIPKRKKNTMKYEMSFERSLL